MAMTTIGLVGAGLMGSGIGGTLQANGHNVITTLAGRSARTAGLVRAAGLTTVPDLEALVRRTDIVLVVTPPAAALDAAREIAGAARTTDARPLVVDLNAVAPSTMEHISGILATVEVDVVDGSISGSPPNLRPGARIYLAGPRVAEVAGLAWAPARPIVVGDTVGKASAVKMCTASVYKGLSGLLAQAMRTADHHDVLDHVIADLSELDDRAHTQVALAATKAHRYVGEMLEIAQTQADAGLTAALFRAYARVFEDLARTSLARNDPETLDRALTPAQVAAAIRST
jgi:3-hydroxyisobutyrate dehydrogenase-like beta-hydroxyacid dehydrogenase